MKKWALCALFLIVFGTASLFAADPAAVTLTGDWTIHVVYDGKTADFTVSPPDWVAPENEKYDSLPIFNPSGPPWRKAMPLIGVNAYECSVFDALAPESVVVRLEPDVAPLVDGTDYILDPRSGNVGRVKGGKIGEKTPVYISYRAVQMRIDSVVQTADGSLQLLRGTPHRVNPEPPKLAEGQKRLANIFLTGQIDKLTEVNLFPILEPAENISFHDDSVENPDPVAKHLIPKTWEKLVRGETVRILAWGDSVTACGFLPEEDRWQRQFTVRLQKKFPQAKIVLLTEAWGGRNTGSYFAQPAGAEHNYQEKVLDVKPDLIISEFVNDAGLNKEQVEKSYGRIRDDFQKIGAEWIILTPHYVRPDWMGFTGQTNIDDDPRPYVKAIREFAAENKIALAEGSALYGRLWRKGIPYNTLMVNNINHPNRIGMSLFADALMKLF